MPTYEYECEKSGKCFDIFQKSMNEDPLKACSFCGGLVRRIISSEAGIISREASFYATDKGRSKRAITKACGNNRTFCGRDNPCASPPCKD